MVFLQNLLEALTAFFSNKADRDQANRELGITKETEQRERARARSRKAAGLDR